jgi:hypothetical protein
METIKTKQIRCIKRGYFNDLLLQRKYGLYGLLSPIMGKQIDSIKFKDNRKIQIHCFETRITKGRTFKRYHIEFNPTNYTMFIITVNDVIYYYCFSNISAPIHSAFDTLTEMYHTYKTVGNDQSVWEHVSLYPCKSTQHWSEKDRNIDTKVVTDVSKEIEKLYYHY